MTQLEISIRDTILFLQKYLSAPTFEEIYRFLPDVVTRDEVASCIENSKEFLIIDDNYVLIVGGGVDREMRGGSDINKDRSNMSGISISDSILGPEDRVKRRLENEAKIPKFLSSNRKLIDKITKNNDVLFLGITPFLQSEFIILAKKNSRLPKEYLNKYIIWNDEEALKSSITNPETQLKLISLVTVKNENKIHQQMLGLLFGKYLKFPNYPITAIPGIRFTNHMEIPEKKMFILFRWFNKK